MVTLEEIYNIAQDDSDYLNRYLATLAFAYMDKNKIDEARFVGIFGKPLQIKKGNLITIPKGTRLRSYNPSKKDWLAGRTYRVVVHHILSGSIYEDQKMDNVVVRNPEIVWVGRSGYWTWAEGNDFEVCP